MLQLVLILLQLLSDFFDNRNRQMKETFFIYDQKTSRAASDC